MADAAASNNHAPFNEIYGMQQITNRFLSLHLRDIIFDLLAPDQCYWKWKESSLPIIGDLNEFRLHMHSLPQYLRHRDEDRAKRAVTPKWTTLNTAIIGFLPVGATWRQTKRFCFICSWKESGKREWQRRM
jgi:hypothetical protein